MPNPPAVDLPLSAAAGLLRVAVNVYASTPILITSGSGVGALLVGLLPGRALGRWGPALIGTAGIVAALIMSAVLWGDRQVGYDGNVRADRFALLLNFILLAAALGHDRPELARARGGGPSRRVRRPAAALGHGDDAGRRARAT